MFRVRGYNSGVSRKERIRILQERVEILSCRVEANPKVSFLPVLKQELSAMQWAVKELLKLTP
jgi:hypothetical protein